MGFIAPYGHKNGKRESCGMDTFCLTGRGIYLGEVGKISFYWKQVVLDWFGLLGLWLEAWKPENFFWLENW